MGLGFTCEPAPAKRLYQLLLAERMYADNPKGSGCYILKNQRAPELRIVFVLFLCYSGALPSENICPLEALFMVRIHAR
jgi:hypothetical protein